MTEDIASEFSPEKIKNKVEAFCVIDPEGGFIFAANTENAAEMEIREGEKWKYQGRFIVPCTVFYTTPPKQN